MADRLRVLLFWLFVASLITGLWMYADARSRIARMPDVLPPPRWPTTQPSWQSPWPAEPPADDAFSAAELGPDSSD